MSANQFGFTMKQAREHFDTVMVEQPPVPPVYVLRMRGGATLKPHPPHTSLAGRVPNIRRVCERGGRDGHGYGGPGLRRGAVGALQGRTQRSHGGIGRAGSACDRGQERQHLRVDHAATTTRSVHPRSLWTSPPLSTSSPQAPTSKSRIWG
jgi:hypothetical protein